MTRSIALLRGINVGGARRIRMADLRALLGELGHANVETVLASGNVVFDARGPGGLELERSLARGIERTFGAAIAFALLPSARLDQIIGDNPLAGVIRDPSRFLVAFACAPGALAAARTVASRSWSPEHFALGPDAAYLWCPDGVYQSPLLKAFSRTTGAGTTARNWQTLLRLQRLAHSHVRVPPRRSRS